MNSEFIVRVRIKVVGDYFVGIYVFLVFNCIFLGLILSISIKEVIGNGFFE